MEFCAEVAIDGCEAGLTAYMCENEHYDIAVQKGMDGYEAVLKLNIGGIKHVQAVLLLKGAKARLVVRADNFQYNFLLLRKMRFLKRHTQWKKTMMSKKAAFPYKAILLQK